MNNRIFSNLRREIRQIHGMSRHTEEIFDILNKIQMVLSAQMDIFRDNSQLNLTENELEEVLMERTNELTQAIRELLQTIEFYAQQ